MEDGKAEEERCFCGLTAESLLSTEEIWSPESSFFKDIDMNPVR